MKYALDTNVAIAALNGTEPVLRRLNAIEAAYVLLPDMVVAELLYEALTSTRAAENLQKVSASWPGSPRCHSGTRLPGASRRPRPCSASVD